MSGFGEFTIKGQDSYISIKIYNQSAYDAAYEQIFGN